MSWDIHWNALWPYCRRTTESRRCLPECWGRARQEQLLECRHFKGYVRVCVQRIFLKNSSKDACVQGRRGALGVGMRPAVHLVASKFGPYMFFTYFERLEAIPLLKHDQFTFCGWDSFCYFYCLFWIYFVSPSETRIEIYFSFQTMN